MSFTLAQDGDSADHFIILKGIDFDTHTELVGKSEWTLINKKTSHIVKLKGDNTGTKVRVFENHAKHLKNSESIYFGDWLLTALSEPYTGLSSIKISKDNKKIFKVNMTLDSLDIEINTPEKAIAGTVEKISWRIPENIPGKFTIQKKDEKPRFYAAPTRLFTKVYKDSQYDLKIPAISGDYIIRFYSLKNTQKAIAEKPIKVLPAKIDLMAPNEAVAGTEIDISWNAPETSKAKINLKFSHNKPDFNARFHVRTIDRKKGKLLLPSIPGNYVLRWFSIYDRQPMFEKKIKLIPQKILIKAPDKATLGTKIDISWEAPKRWQARIVLLPILEKSEQNEPKVNKPKYYDVAHSQGETSTSFTLPDKAGKYTLSFLHASDFRVAAEHSIEVLKNVSE